MQACKEERKSERKEDFSLSNSEYVCQSLRLDLLKHCGNLKMCLLEKKQLLNKGFGKIDAESKIAPAISSASARKVRTPSFSVRGRWSVFVRDIYMNEPKKNQ
jgi:hypothetical protein